MIILNRGEIWWANLYEPIGSSPGYRRPVLIIQADDFNRSNINTVLCAAITTNIRLSQAPGNIFLPMKDSGLPKDSVINISQIVTLDKNNLTERVRRLKPAIISNLEYSLKLILELD